VKPSSVVYALAAAGAAAAEAQALTARIASDMTGTYAYLCEFVGDTVHQVGGDLGRTVERWGL
jgi:hypothetical protein